MYKNKINILILLFTVLLFGCDDFLDKQPEDKLSPDVYYNNVDELKTGLAGCYKVLQEVYDYDGGMYENIEMASDDGKDRYMVDAIHTFKKTNANSASRVWQDNYLMIYRCNVLLGILDSYISEDNAEILEVDAMKGECYFLRGLAYMNLVRTYGDVPKVVSVFGDPSDAFGIGRTQVSEIYSDVIIPDFTKAVAMCFEKGASQLSGEEARAHKGSALMGLAKAQMEIRDYSAAEATLKRMIVDKEVGEYGLMDNLTEVFDPANKFGKESLFEVNFNVAAGQPSWYFRNMTNDISYVIGTTYTNVFMVTHDYLQELHDAGDFERLDLSVDSGYVEGATPEYQAFPKKMAPDRAGRVAVKDLGTDYNFIVFRYADALLMYAECLMNNGKTSDAIPYVNMVRERSNATPLAADFNLDIYRILHERRAELAFECHRFWDLKRTGKAVEIISEALMTVTGEDYGQEDQPIEPYQLLFPIPTAEIQKDQTLPQNAGY
ncbi:RagB/SusD family nutrient uptake outer membrane protein [Saccharicrinis sp. 156]|uniref:RagB/SusD family nutrient uptake outer membrane protein n=1 Tax=Saccharicrinis sp. 156 TaxID=3417574 RepID=UPI003D3346C9